MHHTSYIMDCSKSMLLVMTPFGHVIFIQLGEFAREKTRNILSET